MEIRPQNRETEVFEYGIAPEFLQTDQMDEGSDVLVPEDRDVEEVITPGDAAETHASLSSQSAAHEPASEGDQPDVPARTDVSGQSSDSVENNDSATPEPTEDQLAPAREARPTPEEPPSVADAPPSPPPVKPPKNSALSGPSEEPEPEGTGAENTDGDPAPVQEGSLATPLESEGHNLGATEPEDPWDAWMARVGSDPEMAGKMGQANRVLGQARVENILRANVERMGPVPDDIDTIEQNESLTEALLPLAHAIIAAAGATSGELVDACAELAADAVRQLPSGELVAGDVLDTFTRTLDAASARVVRETNTPLAAIDLDLVQDLREVVVNAGAHNAVIEGLAAYATATNAGISSADCLNLTRELATVPGETDDNYYMFTQTMEMLTPQEVSGLSPEMANNVASKVVDTLRAVQEAYPGEGNDHMHRLSMTLALGSAAQGVSPTYFMNEVLSLAGDGPVTDQMMERLISVPFPASGQEAPPHLPQHHKVIASAMPYSVETSLASGLADIVDDVLRFTGKNDMLPPGRIYAYSRTEGIWRSLGGVPTQSGGVAMPHYILDGSDNMIAVREDDQAKRPRQELRTLDTLFPSAPNIEALTRIIDPRSSGFAAAFISSQATVVITGQLGGLEEFGQVLDFHRSTTDDLIRSNDPSVEGLVVSEGFVNAILAEAPRDPARARARLNGFFEQLLAPQSYGLLIDIFPHTSREQPWQAEQ